MFLVLEVFLGANTVTTIREWANHCRLANMANASQRPWSQSSFPLDALPNLLGQPTEECQSPFGPVPVWPDSYRVRTHEDVYLDDLKARLAEQAAARESKQPCKQNQRRGPPPDRQGRFEFASL